MFVSSFFCVFFSTFPFVFITDCLHLQLYRDSKDRYKNGQTKASLSLEHFLGVETGFTLDKESNTIAIICQDIIVVLAFDTRERLIQWQVSLEFFFLGCALYLKRRVKLKCPIVHIQANLFPLRLCPTSSHVYLPKFMLLVMLVQQLLACPLYLNKLYPTRTEASISAHKGIERDGRWS